MAYTTINKSTDYFNTVLYTGNGSTQSITGVGFQPDWLWIKPRSSANRHTLYDVLRGTNSISSDSNAAQVDRSADGFTSLDSDGFTLNGSGAGGDTNYNSRTHVAWNWKAANAQGSSNTDGSINTTYTSVNTTAGFSISTYTGTGSNATIGHGLGAAPGWIIVKRLDSSSTWRIFHKSLGATKNMGFDNGTALTQSVIWNDTAPTSSVFSVGTAGDTNNSSSTFVAYCFAEKTGYSKFGSYTGNGNADGAFIYTGFKPAMVIIKLYSTGAENWRIFDNKRIGYNPNNYKLYPSSNSAEGTSDLIDIYCNGFKPRTTSIESNGSGNDYIYMAFAEVPLVGTNNIPALAR